MQVQVEKWRRRVSSCPMRNIVFFAADERRSPRRAGPGARGAGGGGRAARPRAGGRDVSSYLSLSRLARRPRDGLSRRMDHGLIVPR